MSVEGGIAEDPFKTIGLFIVLFVLEAAVALGSSEEVVPASSNLACLSLLISNISFSWTFRSSGDSGCNSDIALANFNKYNNE